mgnify:CR=1 FL=1
MQKTYFIADLHLSENRPHLLALFRQFMQERAIQRQAKHNLQLQSEMAGYQHRVGNVELALRKNTNFRTAPQYQQIIEQFKTKEQGMV